VGERRRKTLALPRFSLQQWLSYKPETVLSENVFLAKNNIKLLL
jgi:hypothetical protein